VVENPESWGPLEQAISRGMRLAAERRKQGIIGASAVKIIADEVRKVAISRKFPEPQPQGAKDE